MSGILPGRGVGFKDCGHDAGHALDTNRNIPAQSVGTLKKKR